MATEAAALAAILVLLAVGPAHADDPPAEDEPTLTGLELRFGYYEQDGRGLQSQDGIRGTPGSEWAQIFQPMALFRIRQGEHMRHTLVIPVDVVTAASPDALDAISSASRQNESVGVDMTTDLDRGDDDVQIRWAVHFEEPFRSGSLGAGWTRHLAEDNATVSLSGLASYDYFDNISPYGFTAGQRTRLGVNANLAASQLLSPTTIVDGSYGLTYQVGVLEQTWNAVPMGIGQPPAGEKFPHERLRQAFAGRVAQHLPWTRSTLKLAYRYYLDDFGLHAHTVELRAYQYLTRWLVVRGSWRWHRQDGVDFYTENATLAPAPGPLQLRTADSDLDAFVADELGVRLMLVAGRVPWAWLRPHTLALSYDRYTRDNGLTMDVVALEWGRTF